MQLPNPCTLCPRACRADRAHGQRGFCGADGTLRVARAALHHWEEPCLSGDPNAATGSGTVFFSNCALRCCYCQNYPISQGDVGKEITVERLTEIFLALQKSGAKNLNCLGTSALIANMADVVIAVKDADFYVTAPSEVTAEESYEAGTVDVLCDTFEEAVDAAKNIASLLPSNNISPAPLFEFAAPSTFANDGDDAMTVINSIADANSVVELKGGYSENKCKTVLATVMGTTVGFVAFEGEPICPCCSYKAEAMVKLCDAYSIPVVTLVNANGAVNKAGKENQCLTAFTKLTSAYATATTPKISVITGNAVGIAYIALAGKGANADFTFAWDKSVASPLPTESAVQFLFNERLANGESKEELKKEYTEKVASPFTAAACGAVDDIFAPADTRAKVIAALDILAGKRENTLPRKHSVK